ncbi:MAG: response regulator [Desulfobacterales bacterium]|jgi:DNA-binding response OmpR family regulator
MKVLLVDDEKKFAVMLSRRLALRGIDVDFVHTGEAAIDIAKQNQYDVAILDVKMPGMGGIELKQKLMQLDPGMKFIFLTGHGSGVDIETGSKEGSACLAKPLRIEKLMEILHDLTG